MSRHETGQFGTIFTRVDRTSKGSKTALEVTTILSKRFEKNECGETIQRSRFLIGLVFLQTGRICFYIYIYIYIDEYFNQ